MAFMPKGRPHAGPQVALGQDWGHGRSAERAGAAAETTPDAIELRQPARVCAVAEYNGFSRRPSGCSSPRRPSAARSAASSASSAATCSAGPPQHARGDAGRRGPAGARGRALLTDLDDAISVTRFGRRRAGQLPVSAMLWEPWARTSADVAGPDAVRDHPGGTPREVHAPGRQSLSPQSSPAGCPRCESPRRRKCSGPLVPLLCTAAGGREGQVARSRALCLRQACTSAPWRARPVARRRAGRRREARPPAPLCRRPCRTPRSTPTSGALATRAAA